MTRATGAMLSYGLTAWEPRSPGFSRSFPTQFPTQSKKATREGGLLSLYFKGLYGGRDRDRTCDPYDVNVVLSR